MTKISEFTEKLLHLADKNINIITAVLLIFALIIQSIPITRAVAEIVSVNTVSDWGLSFGTSNTPPRGNVSAQELLDYNAFFIGDTSSKTIYLTFDAGYENGYTSQILDVLKKHGVSAAFFLVSHYIKTNPELVLRMAEEGHIVANHTATHPDMSKISDIESLSAELEPVETLYKEITGNELTKLYRPPQGKFNKANLENAAALGYTTLFWSLAYADWDTKNQPSKAYATEKLNSRIHNGAVVLLHSTSATNAAILDTLLTEWKEQGYVFGSVLDFIP